MEKYEITAGQLFLVDPELELNIQVPFAFQPLPDQLLGVPDLCVERDAEGRLLRAFQQKDGKKHGPMRSFYQDGKVEGESYYCDGLLHGPSIFYNELGKILSKTWFYHGKRVGKAYQYYLSGKLYKIRHFKEGIDSC
jgi:hypothetical protein